MKQFGKFVLFIQVKDKIAFISKQRRQLNGLGRERWPDREGF